MSFHHTVLLIGATSGIGAAMADKLVAEGSKVIAVGRRQDRLDAFVSKHGSYKASGVSFDISDLAKIPSFVADVTKKHPDIDCVFLNAGTQKPWDLSKPESIDMKTWDEEMHVNYTCQVALTVAFLPFLVEKKGMLIYTTSHLGQVPGFMIPAYSATKAALCSFILSLRESVKDKGVKVIDLSPPVVQTELHDYQGEEKGRAMGMPADKFCDEAYNGLVAGDDHILIGNLAGGDPARLSQIVQTKREAFEDMAGIIKKMHT